MVELAVSGAFSHLTGRRGSRRRRYARWHVWYYVYIRVSLIDRKSRRRYYRRLFNQPTHMSSRRSSLDHPFTPFTEANLAEFCDLVTRAGGPQEVARFLDTTADRIERMMEGSHTGRIWMLKALHGKVRLETRN
jgi:hypothetical protein